MKKVFSSGLVLFLGFSSQAFASAGYANDGLEFAVALMGFLALLAGFLKGTDYIHKNGKRLSLRFIEYFKEKEYNLRDLLMKAKYEYSDMSFFKKQTYGSTSGFYRSADLVSCRQVTTGHNKPAPEAR